MDQRKTGAFLKELRKEKNLTQEELAEKLGVSRRTVSRWETGSNMPDLDVLMELSDYYCVELLELLNGERKDEEVERELEETVQKVAQLSNEEKLRLTKRIHMLYIAGLMVMVLYMTLFFTDRADNFLGGFCLGVTLGMMILGVILTSRYAAKIRVFKMRMLRCSRKDVI